MKHDFAPISVILQMCLQYLQIKTAGKNSSSSPLSYRIQVQDDLWLFFFFLLLEVCRSSSGRAACLDHADSYRITELALTTAPTRGCILRVSHVCFEDSR